MKDETRDTPGRRFQHVPTAVCSCTVEFRSTVDPVTVAIVYCARHAAAPELLEALRDLADEVEAGNEVHDDECITLCEEPEGEKCRIGHGCWCTNVNFARAAIAKAEG